MGNPQLVYDQKLTLLAKETAKATIALQNGDGGSNSGGMEARVTVLESQMQEVRHDLAWIKDRLGKMPTVAGLWGMVATTIAVSLTVLGIIVMVFQFKYQIAATTIAPVAAPIVIQMPAYPQPAPTPQAQVPAPKAP